MGLEAYVPGMKNLVSDYWEHSTYERDVSSRITKLVRGALNGVGNQTEKINVVIIFHASGGGACNIGPHELTIKPGRCKNCGEDL